MNSDTRAALLLLAMNRKLQQSAVTERRWDDANYYGKWAQACEVEARRLLSATGLVPPVTHK